MATTPVKPSGFNPISLGIGAATAVIPALLGGKKKTRQVPLETPERKQARKDLSTFSQTGRFGEFQAGADVGVGGGDLDATDLEKEGLTKLQALLKSGQRGGFGVADKAIQDILSDTDTGEGRFGAFKSRVQRELDEARDRFKRGAAFGGTLFSTNTQRELGKLEARGAETLTAELGRLESEERDRKLAAIPLALQSEQAQEATELTRISEAERLGGLTRKLNDEAIQRRDREILRRRAELKLPIEAASQLAGGPATFGIPEVETSPFQDLLGVVGKVGGEFLGNELFLEQFKKKFPGKVPGARV